MKLSDNLKSIRKENNLSQEQLAEKLGVSRQAVSKWESGQSYPEMDKVLLICKLFHYNMDELMNENVKEVDETKQSKLNFNKYVEDFFHFITKTVEMLSMMSFKQKFKCFFEQIMILLFLVCLFAIIGGISSNILDGLIGRLPSNIYYTVTSILGSIYIILAFIVGVTILLHVFKIRYLDYYEIVKEEDVKENDEKIENAISKNVYQEEKKKIAKEKKREKIIIRDPEHSQSRFLTGIIKIVLWFIKIMVAFIAIGFVFSFVVLVALFVLSFLFVKAGLVFWGGLLGIIAALIVNFVILQIFYYFIVSKKTHKIKIAILLISSFILGGLGIGIMVIGFTEFHYIEQTNIETENVFQMPMAENLSIYTNNVHYIETDSNEVKIVVTHSKYDEVHIENEDETIYVYSYQKEQKIMEAIQDIINDINRKEIGYNYYINPKIYVYTSKNNIEKLKQNSESKQEKRKERELSSLYDANKELERQIVILKDRLDEKENEVKILQQEKDNIIVNY